MVVQNGTRPNREGRGGRGILAPRPTATESLLAGIHFDGFDIHETRRFANALVRERDRWADVNRHGRRYSDRETATYRRNALARRDGGK